MNETRNYGIDLLKIVSMTMVVVLHIFGWGGVLRACEINSMNYLLGLLLKVISFPAVNIFALTTGYLMIDRNPSLSKFSYRWVQAITYSVIGSMVCVLFFNVSLSRNEWLATFLPLSCSEWEYLTEYFGVCLFMPFLNLLVKTIGRSNAKRLVVTIIIAASLWTTISFQDPLNLISGYSVAWIAVLYIIGACIKHYHLFDKLKQWIIICFLLLSLVFTFCFTLITGNLNPSIGINDFDQTFLQYTSPTILCNAIALLLLFSKVHIKHGQKPIKFFSKHSFAVFLIHTQIAIRKHVLIGICSPLANLDFLSFVCFVALIVILVYCLSCIIEFIRDKLYYLFRLNAINEKVCNKVKLVFTAAITKIQ